VEGDKPIGLVIGAVVLGAMVALPAFIVPAFYLFANVYALIAGSDFGSETINVGAFVTGLVLSVATFLLLLAGAVSFIGRALSPKHREV
jgi:hypothetical protein